MKEKTVPVCSLEKNRIEVILRSQEDFIQRMWERETVTKTSYNFREKPKTKNKKQT